MAVYLELYRLTLDFLYKISGPMIAIAIIGLIFKYRKELANFISKNISKISGKVAGQDFEIDFNKLKESQSEPVKIDSAKNMSKENSEVEQLKKQLEFEKIYSIIFGSQIELLKRLRANKKDFATELLFFYTVTRSEFNIYESWSFEEFIQILVQNNLVNIHSNGAEIKITEKGLDFLRYIEENNYNDRLF